MQAFSRVMSCAQMIEFLGEKEGSNKIMRLLDVESGEKLRALIEEMDFIWLD